MSIKKRDVTKVLPVELTEKELLQIGTKMVVAQREGRRLGSEKKSVTDEFKDRIGAQNTIVRACEENIDTGLEHRDVDCEETWNYENGKVETVRKDTGEMVDDRAMSALERQMDISDIPGASPEEFQLVKDAIGGFEEGDAEGES